jgi:hypothetical protein
MVLMAGFWELYEIDFGFHPKTCFHPHDLLFHHANLQKFLMSASNCFKGRNTAKQCQFLSA